MGGRQTAILIGAVTAGLVAAVAAGSSVSRAGQRAARDAKPTDVLVVKAVVARGVDGDAALAKGLVGPDKIPRRFRPQTSVTSADAIRGKVAVSQLAPGQIVVQGAFADPQSASTSFAARIPEGQVAISVQVNEVRGVARLIAPGDEVNILVVTADGVHPLFQNVRVIAVGETPAPQPGEQVRTGAGDASRTDDRSLVTLAVPLLAAEKIALAVATAGEDGLFLTLVPPESGPVAVPPINASTLFQGSTSPYA